MSHAPDVIFSFLSTFGAENLRSNKRIHEETPEHVFGDEALGFGVVVWGLVGVWGLGFGVWGLKIGVWGLSLGLH